MSKVKKHHYVPQVYLRYFSKQKGKNSNIISVVEKKTGKFFVSNIADIAMENNYNRAKEGRFLPEVPIGNELHYEKKFQELIEND